MIFSSIDDEFHVARVDSIAPFEPWPEAYEHRVFDASKSSSWTIGLDVAPLREIAERMYHRRNRIEEQFARVPDVFRQLVLTLLVDESIVDELRLLVRREREADIAS